MGKTMALSEDGEIITLRAFPFYTKDIIKSCSWTFNTSSSRLLLSRRNESKSDDSPAAGSKKNIHSFAVKYRNLYLNPSTKESDVFDSFVDECFALKFEMDCGKQFEAKYSHDAFYKAESLNQIIDQVDDISVLSSGIFSKYRYVTYWSHSNLLDEDNRSWFIQAFYQLARITE